ncbi:hypothetical protein AMJ87_01735 [candidate division WOR_3 bacterium SM23_60]|uniref:Uncharacterized protein n=1 Tax=candidate division WOR_3 bacterium SM23_60 TaxID=1703780 RepID=A0A0S8GNK1_UNCW3|nr:MAG: hypothetical protein AMJ87_01735 [candidate division WOR_3 bacterium SM23_60]
MVLLSLFIASQISEGDTTFNELDSVYYRYQIIESDTTLYDSLFAPVTIDTSKTPAGGLRMSGTKDFSFDVDQGFDQGLTVGIAGEIEGIRVEGNLSDRATPSSTIQLSEVEKVNLKISSRNFYGGLGTLSLGLPFGITDEIYGSRIGVRTADNEQHANAAYAVNRGAYQRLQLRGEEGKQSPYFLGGSVIAGTERVYLADGLAPTLLLERDRDYTIDYTSGIVSFTNRNIITNRSRIEIEYEQAIEDYQNIYLEGDGTTTIGRFAFTGMYRRKYDDRNNPLTFTLSSAQEESLRIAGDSSIVRYTFADTSSEGNYILEQGHFVYVGEGNGDYRVTFFYVGENNGEYVYDPTQKAFVYQGTGFGNYSPTKLVPLPVADDFYGLGADFYELLSVEVLGSDYDKNSFSPRDDEDNTGTGYRLRLDAKPYIFTIRGAYINYEKTLTMPQGKQEIDYQYQWNTDEPLEEMGSVFVGAQPLPSLRMEAGYGRLNDVHTRTSLVVWPAFFYLGYEAVDSVNRYYTGMDKVLGNLSLNARYERIRASHLLRYGTQYTVSKNTAVGISGSYDKDTTSRGITTVFALSTEPLKLNLGHRSYNDTTFLFGDATANLRLANVSLVGNLQHSQRYSQKRDEVYIGVEEGEGNYVFDSTTNTYIEKEGGDYKREIFLLQEFDRVVTRTYSFEARYTQSILDALGRFSYIDEKNFTSYTNDLALSLGQRDYSILIDVMNDYVQDARYAIATEMREQRRLTITPTYQRLSGRGEVMETINRNDNFVNEKKNSYTGELSYRILLRPLLRPRLSYTYTTLYSDFYDNLNTRLHKPQIALLFGFPLYNRGRLETTGSLIYRSYNVEMVPFLFTANEPAGLSKRLNVTGSLALGTNTVFSLIYRIEFPPDNDYHQNLRFQTKIRF